MEEISDKEKVGAEVYKVLENIPKEEYNKIPDEIKAIFEKYKNYSREINIDLKKGFEEQDISEEAKDIIYSISFNYWLTDKEKENVMDNIKQNVAELKEKYDIENVFKERKNEEKVANKIVEEQRLANTNEKWYKKILRKIKKIFGKDE